MITAKYAVAAIATGALIASPLALSAEAQPHAAPGTVKIGNVAYVAKNQAVRIASISGTGATSSVQTIGPVTPAKSGQTITVSDLVGSGDGDWVAWDEEVTAGHGARATFKNVLALRDVPGNVTFSRTTGQFPVGFAGSTLITSDGTHTEQVDLKPSFHFVKIPHAQYPLGTYGNGVVDETSSQAPAGPRHTDKLRLTSVNGVHTPLHSYVLKRNQYDDPDAAYISGDGKRLVIERGNHQDFGGLGPSSLADEFNLASGNSRHQLGNYGTARDAWRIENVSFAGSGDAVWAVWERATKTGATAVVATFSGGNWQRTLSSAIAVAGNSAGYVIEQPGKFVSTGGEGGEDFATTPTAGAKLAHGSTTVSLGIEGNAFVWVN